MKKLIIIGAGGHGKVCSEIAKKKHYWESIEFIDDRLEGESINGIRVIGSINSISNLYENYSFLVAIGDNKKRKEIIEFLISLNLNLISLVDSSSQISDFVYIDIGTVIMPGVVINANTRIGKGCIINSGSIIEHDNIIEDYVHISPGVNCAGNVLIGNSTWIGIGSTIVNNISICPNCLIGAGTLITKDIIEDGKYYGSPARKIES